MKKIDEEIERILTYKKKSKRKKIDALLEMDAEIYANMGTDTTTKERLKGKKDSIKIYKAIKQIDDWFGTQLLLYFNK